ncbi:Bifunctional PGK/TIM [Candidatus Rubidus massiliensis]|nr:Bifunctional PGK/TIM [Candidatus Rubidus massiliensis]
MSAKLTVKDLDLKGKKVLVRVDFNVPLKNGMITDDTRIKACLPTIQYLIDHKAKIILLSHLGRPKGKKNLEMSLAPCAKRLGELLKLPVKMAKDCIGDEVKKEVDALKEGEILLLENLRFYEAEEKPEKDSQFVKQLSQLADLYINDAFGTAHRKHASTYYLAKEFPQKAAAGLLLQKEIDFLGKALANPEKPFYAIIGGAKISTKIGVLQSLISVVDKIFIGGAMAYTFFKAQGLEVGKSLCEDEYLEQAKEIMNVAEKQKVSIILPIDTVITKEIKEQASSKVVSIQEGIPKEMEGVDIGPQTIKLFKQELKDAKTIFWNGPLGVFEVDEFAKGTEEVATFIANLNCTTIVGGGDSIAALNKLHLANKISHISTGGGASLEYIEHHSLPGIDVLSDK